MENLHREVWENEKAMMADTPWEHWVRKAEALVGHSLDGDQNEDGYSLDFAYDAFKAGQTPEQYISTLRK